MLSCNEASDGLVQAERCALTYSPPLLKTLNFFPPFLSLFVEPEYPTGRILSSFLLLQDPLHLALDGLLPQALLFLFVAEQFSFR